MVTLQEIAMAFLMEKKHGLHNEYSFNTYGYTYQFSNSPLYQEICNEKY